MRPHSVRLLPPFSECWRQCLKEKTLFPDSPECDLWASGGPEPEVIYRRPQKSVGGGEQRDASFSKPHCPIDTQRELHPEFKILQHSV